MVILSQYYSCLNIGDHAARNLSSYTLSVCTPCSLSYRYADIWVHNDAIPWCPISVCRLARLPDHSATVSHYVLCHQTFVVCLKKNGHRQRLLLLFGYPTFHGSSAILVTGRPTWTAPQLQKWQKCILIITCITRIFIFSCETLRWKCDLSV